MRLQGVYHVTWFRRDSRETRSRACVLGFSVGPWCVLGCSRHRPSLGSHSAAEPLLLEKALPSLPGIRQSIHHVLAAPRPLPGRAADTVCAVSRDGWVLPWIRSPRPRRDYAPWGGGSTTFHSLESFWLGSCTDLKSAATRLAEAVCSPHTPPCPGLCCQSKEQTGEDAHCRLKGNGDWLGSTGRAKGQDPLLSPWAAPPQPCYGLTVAPPPAAFSHCGPLGHGQLR